MHTKATSLSLAFIATLMICASLAAAESSTAGAGAYGVRSEDSRITESALETGIGAGTTENTDGTAASVARKSPKQYPDGEYQAAIVRFRTSGCAFRDPAAAKSYSKREIYSILLALSDSGAETAKPFAESPDTVDKGARQAAERMIELQEEKNARIREIMLKEKMDYDTGVTVFANQVTAGISPDRFEGAVGRNLLPFAARHHAMVIALSLEALEFSEDEEARELAHDLIIEHAEALAHVKELQEAD